MLLRLQWVMRGRVREGASVEELSVRLRLEDLSHDVSEFARGIGLVEKGLRPTPNQ